MSTDPQFLAWAEKQFEAKGDDFIFRRDGKGPAYVVSAIERTTYIDRYNKAASGARSWLMRYIFLGLLVSAFVFFTFDIAYQSWIGWPISFAILCTTVWIYVGRIRSTTVEFDAMLPSRAPIAGSLTKTEARRIFLARVSYRQLAIAPFLGLVILFPPDGIYDPLHGWGRLAWIFPVALALLASVQAYRKWAYSKV